jgi:acyl dehydratase
VNAYAAVSGDSNPIHLDPAVALRVGFERPAVHGMLIVAYIHEAAEAWAGDGFVVSQTTQFLKPLLVGNTLTITGRVARVFRRDDVAHAILRVMALAPDERPACVAEVEIAERFVDEGAM